MATHYVNPRWRSPRQSSCEDVFEIFWLNLPLLSNVLMFKQSAAIKIAFLHADEYILATYT